MPSPSPHSSSREPDLPPRPHAGDHDPGGAARKARRWDLEDHQGGLTHPSRPARRPGRRGRRTTSRQPDEWHHTLSYVPERIEWDDDAAQHIRTRSQRYPDALDIEPEWTAEAVNDPDRIVDEPDPFSAHAKSVRVVGYSHSGALLITVVALRDRHGGLARSHRLGHHRQTAPTVPGRTNR